jgi:hypothetical protein
VFVYIKLFEEIKLGAVIITLLVQSFRVCPSPTSLSGIPAYTLSQFDDKQMRIYTVNPLVESVASLQGNHYPPPLLSLSFFSKNAK